MAKRSVVVDMTSYGIYSTWDSKSKDLPKIQKSKNLPLRSMLKSTLSLAIS